MNIIKCECGKELSKDTNVCPECKKEQKGKYSIKETTHTGQKLENQSNEPPTPWGHVIAVSLFFGVILIAIGLFNPYVGSAGIIGVILTLFATIVLLFRTYRKILNLGYRRIGIILILIGIGIPSILFLSTRIYGGERAVVVINMRYYSEDKYDYGGRYKGEYEVTKNEWDRLSWCYKNGVSAPYKYIVVSGIISILGGIGMILLPKNPNSV